MICVERDSYYATCLEKRNLFWCIIIEKVRIHPETVPQGRKKIAHQFIGGKTVGVGKSPARDGRGLWNPTAFRITSQCALGAGGIPTRRTLLISSVPGGTHPAHIPVPPMNRWAIFFRPRGTHFCGTLPHAGLITVPNSLFKFFPACSIHSSAGK